MANSTQNVRDVKTIRNIDIPNEETIAAMEEIEEMIASGKPPRFETAEDMFKELGI